MKLSVIIVAAGSGQRLGGGGKALLTLAGRPLLAYVLEMWQGLADTMVVAARPEDIPAIGELSAPYGGRVQIAEGGANRAESVARALATLSGSDQPELIAVHDGARPLTSTSDIRRVIAQAESAGAAILAAPVSDTVRWQGENGRCGPLLPREQLVAAQTPQIFRRQWLQAAYAQADQQALAAATDDAALVMAAGYPTAFVWAESPNLKLTRPEDLLIAEAILKNR